MRTMATAENYAALFQKLGVFFKFSAWFRSVSFLSPHLFR